MGDNEGNRGRRRKRRTRRVGKRERGISDDGQDRDEVVEWRSIRKGWEKWELERVSGIRGERKKQG